MVKNARQQNNNNNSVVIKVSQVTVGAGSEPIRYINLKHYSFVFAKNSFAKDLLPTSCSNEYAFIQHFLFILINY